MGKGTIVGSECHGLPRTLDYYFNTFAGVGGVLVWAVAVVALAVVTECVVVVMRMAYRVGGMRAAWVVGRASGNDVILGMRGATRMGLISKTGKVEWLY